MLESYLQLFSYKNNSQAINKIFATPCFFLDHLKHKTVKKQFSIFKLVGEIFSYCDCFLKLLRLTDLSDKVYLINFKFSYLGFSTVFWQEKCKTAATMTTTTKSLTSLVIKEFIMVSILCNLTFIFFHELSKNRGNRSWHKLSFIIPVKKYDWLIHENTFT